MKTIKYLIAFAIFFLFTSFVPAQVQGCVWTGALDTTTNVDYYQCRSAGEFWYLTVALIDSADTITVYSGTNLPDSTYQDEIYTRVSLKNITDGEVQEVVTGHEATGTYMVLWGYKRKNLKIEATAISDTTTYYIETY